MSENIDKMQAMKIAVAGGTGVVGQHVVDGRERAGHEVVPLARSVGVDLTTGAGLAERLAGVDAVVDVTSVPTQNQAESEAFFGGVTRASLVAAETGRGRRAPRRAVDRRHRRRAERLLRRASGCRSGSWPRATSRGACCGRRSSTSSPSRRCTSCASGRSRWCRG